MNDTIQKILSPSIEHIVALHDRIISDVGGAPGIRSIDAIAGAWGRTETRRFYGDIDVCGVAATIGVSIAKAHGFADGNKRAAYGALQMTLAMNGVQLTAEPVQTIKYITHAASGDGDPDRLADWLRLWSRPDPVYVGLFKYDLGEEPAP